MLKHDFKRNDTYWGNLQNSALSYQLSAYIEQHPGSYLLVTEDNLSTYQLKEEIGFFLKNSPQPIDLQCFPDWETLPYDTFSPHHDLISERLSILSKLANAQQKLIICSIQTLMHKLPPKNFINSNALLLEVGEKLQLDAFKTKLVSSGYRVVKNVLEHGECAFRGAIIDLFPMGSKQPIRIDLFDDEIDTIRIFCPESQRSVERIQQVKLLPAYEYPLNEQSITLFRRQWRSQFSGNPTHCAVYNEVSEGMSPAGIEYYLPLFFESLETVFDYLPEDTTIINTSDITANATQFWEEIKLRYEQRKHDISRPLLNPNALFLSPEVTFSKIKDFHTIRCNSQAFTNKSHALNFTHQMGPDLFVQRSAQIPLTKLKQYIDSNANKKNLISVESPGRREVLLEMLQDLNITPNLVSSWKEFTKQSSQLSIIVGPLSHGVELEDTAVNIIVESQLFNNYVSQKKQRRNKNYSADVIIKDLSELRVGSPVVHIEHGVGRYKGLIHLTLNGTVGEFIVLTYADEDKIYVPVTSLHLLSRYTGGDGSTAPLHKLGSDKWNKEKKKAVKSISDVAVKLLDIYSKRASLRGFQHKEPDELYRAFVSKFPFEETEDQLLAIQNILSDMQSPKPMDRLVCGDVGFGKTEVAMRATFLAVQNKKQVCILVPTTLLAEQHFQNFKDRFADFPVNIALLSRFRSAKEVNQTTDKLQHGLVDIVIGTHKLIQKSIKFKSLGLVVIDEEHRFGVQQKEHLKSLRHEVDVLSLTATPIPRSLNLAMSGLRDISIIATPPAKRLAVKTFWQEANNTVIREAILREIMRGGQVFYLHNNVETIQYCCEKLRDLVPEAKIEIAHGQMREKQLERIMSDFYHHRFNVVVCTTIIETGIDIPTANTILIDRADKFGLAQLHQLRGRVGRSHHQAYAYLLSPNKKAITSDAVKRLEALTSIEDLGAGFLLATHDLEIRGAGELLGQEQSGKMHSIGFNLYMEMLEKAVESLKQGKEPDILQPFDVGPEIELRIKAIIPEEYLSDVHLRLTLYKRISSAATEAELKDLQVEMIDRFGLLPEAVKNLFYLAQIKIRCQQIGIRKITARASGAIVDFDECPKIDPQNIIRLIQVFAARYRLDGPTRIKILQETTCDKERLDMITDFIEKLCNE